MRHHWLTRAAWFNAGTHAVASVGMVVLLRRGLPGPEFANESGNGLRWIRDNAGIWSVGWGLWTLAALSIFGLAVVAATQRWCRASPERGMSAVLAAACVMFGAAIDIFGQAAMVAAAFAEYSTGAQISLGMGLFASGVVGNSLYSIGLLLLTLVWHRVWSPRTRSLGYASGAIGLGLTPIAYYEVLPILTMLVTGALFVCVVAWSVSLALEAEPSSEAIDAAS